MLEARWSVIVLTASVLGLGCKSSNPPVLRERQAAIAASLPRGCLVAAEIRPRELAAIGVSVRKFIASRAPAANLIKNIDFDHDITKVRYCHGGGRAFALLIDGTISDGVKSGILDATLGHAEVVSGISVVQRERLWVAFRPDANVSGAGEVIIAADRPLLEEVLGGASRAYFRHDDRPVAIAIGRTELARLATKDPRIQPVVSSLESLEMELSPDGGALETLVNLTSSASFEKIASQVENAVKAMVESSGVGRKGGSRVSVVQDRGTLRVMVPLSSETLAAILR